MSTFKYSYDAKLSSDVRPFIREAAHHRGQIRAPSMAQLQAQIHRGLED